MSTSILEEGRNRVEIMVKEDLVEQVIEVKRLDYRMMKILDHCKRNLN